MDTNRIRRLPELFRTLSNPNRLAIFEAIRELSCSGPAGCEMDERSCVDAVRETVKIAPSTLSEHLTGTTKGRHETVLSYAVKLAKHEVGHIGQMERALGRMTRSKSPRSDDTP